MAELKQGAFEENCIPFSRQIIVSSQPKIVQLANGEKGEYYQESWEEKTQSNWRRRKFVEFDRLMAGY
ncbi:MAG: hypothetical protein MK052_11765 [Alphaproteobacteria bacterium]|nr:hypothetical protein [Alphaproteobacteria bacterium]